MPTRTTLETYDYLRQIAPELSTQFHADAARSHNEEEFRIAATQRFAQVAAELGITLTTRHEYTLATGRADAVYNRFIIEYENPGVLNASPNHAGTRHAVGQVNGYLKELARAEHHDRLLGAAFDGYYVVFVRYHSGHVLVEEPLALTPASTERFLRGLFSLSSGRALIAQNLVEDFGSGNTTSQKATRAFYNALACCADDQATLPARLFAQWKVFFGEVAGYEAAGGQLAHRRELIAFARGMGLAPETTDASRLFFAIHTYFSFLVKNIARLVLSAYTAGSLGLKQHGAHLRVLAVDDMSSLQVFEGASTRTSVFAVQKGQPTSYPVRYTLWKKSAAGRLDYDRTLEEVIAQTRRLEFFAIPVDRADATSALLTARRKALDAVRNSMFNVGDYTFARWKVVWPNMGDRLDAAVVSECEGKVVIPQHIVTVLSLESSEEAHYIAAVVNSLPFQYSAHSYSQSGGKSFATPQILENVRVPRFFPADSTHHQLSVLSQRAHELALLTREGDASAQAELRKVEAQVDTAAARLWGLSDDELAEIVRSLKELK